MGQQVWGEASKGDPIKARIPAGRFGEPVEVADLVLFLAVTFRKDVAAWRLFRPPAERVTPPWLLCHRAAH